MNHRPSTLAVAAVLAAAIGLGNVQPARADGAASTRNIILGAAALAAGIIISRNVAHKRELANTVAGYTSDGATVYADGRVVYPDGRSFYPNDNNQSIACRQSSCTIFNGDGSTGYSGFSRWNGSAWVADASVSASAGPGYSQNQYSQNGYNQGGYNQGGYNQGGYNQGGYNQGGYNQGGYNQGGYNQGGYAQNGYAQGGGYANDAYRGSYRDGYNAYLVAYRDYLAQYDAYVRAYYEAFARATVSNQRGYRYASPAPPPAPRPFCCDPGDNPATSGRY
jgi:hypothetical protein